MTTEKNESNKLKKGQRVSISSTILNLFFLRSVLRCWPKFALRKRFNCAPAWMPKKFWNQKWIKKNNLRWAEEKVEKTEVRYTIEPAMSISKIKIQQTHYAYLYKESERRIRQPSRLTYTHEKKINEEFN